MTTTDVINHPNHYTDGKIEVIDFIEDKQLNFNRGNVVKYISRAGEMSSCGGDSWQSIDGNGPVREQELWLYMRVGELFARLFGSD